MTSLAFVLGVLPLAIANRRRVGEPERDRPGVIGGMLTATFLAPFLIPMFFFVVTEKLFKRGRAAPRRRCHRAVPAGDRAVGGAGGNAVAHALVVALTLIAGCSLQPAYERPRCRWPRPTRAARRTNLRPVDQPAALAAVDIGWRDFLTDPRLQRLVEIGLSNNRDLRVAALNVAQAQAQYRIERAPLYPNVGAICRCVERPHARSFSTSAVRPDSHLLGRPIRRLGDRLLRPPAEPERPGAAAVLRHRAGT